MDTVRQGLEAERLWRLVVLVRMCISDGVVRQGLEAERLWRQEVPMELHPVWDDVRQGHEAERLWRQFLIIRNISPINISPTRARSRKALATKQKRLGKLSPTAGVRKGLEAERLWRPVAGCDKVANVALSEKCSKPKGSGDLYSLVRSLEPNCCPKRARSRKALATGYVQTDISASEQSEKGSKPKGSGDSRIFWRFTSFRAVRKGLEAERLWRLL